MNSPIHLLDFDADFQTRWLAAAAAGDSLLTVGRGGDYRDFWAAARWLKCSAPPGEVHAWGIKALVAAALAGNRRIIFTPPPEMGEGVARRLPWMARRRDLTIICPTTWLRTGLCRRGLAPDKCVLVRPGVSIASPALDAQLRMRLGFSPEDFVLLAPGESTRAAGHSLALWAAAILHELDTSWKLLAWGHGPLANQLWRLCRRMNHTRLLHLARREQFHDLPAAADAAIVTAAPAAATLPIAMCMAHGLPIVATPVEGLTPRNSVLVMRRSPRALAQALLELRRDAARRQSLGQAARTESRRLV